MKDHIKALIQQEIDKIKESRSRKTESAKSRKEREAILSHDIDLYLSYTWKPKKIWFPKWWPKALDVNLWSDTPEKRMNDLIKAAALIHLEIERMEMLSIRKNYKIWAESIIPGDQPLYIGESVGISFDEAVELFIKLLNNSHNIQPEKPNSYNSKAEWESRKSNWNINGQKLYPTKEEAHANSKR